MKLPGYMVPDKGKGTLSPDGKSVVFTFRIRLWHPGLWWMLLRHWWGKR